LSLWRARWKAMHSFDSGVPVCRSNARYWSMPDPEQRPEEKWGIEDPRITWLAELERYAGCLRAFRHRAGFPFIDSVARPLRVAAILSLSYRSGPVILLPEERQ
jgi:hypothetical protein